MSETWFFIVMFIIGLCLLMYGVEQADSRSSEDAAEGYLIWLYIFGGAALMYNSIENPLMFWVVGKLCG